MKMPQVFGRIFSRLHSGELLIQLGEHQHRMQGSHPGHSGEIQIHRPLSFARRILTHGHVGLGEAYMAGDWDSPDPTGLLLTLAENQQAFSEIFEGSWFGRLRRRLGHRRRANTKRGSRRNIRQHYDLGNDFYRLWLDPSMTYSSAVFAEMSSTEPCGTEKPGTEVLGIMEHSEKLIEQPISEAALEAAQQNKYQRLLDMVDARPGERLLEIGCGWGGLAEAAAERGLAVTGITLSTEQLDWTRQRLAAAGAEAVVLRLQDYRDLDETFDHIISIEMYEAVGEAYWPTYMQTLARCLAPGGTAALQVITIDPSMFEDYRAHPDFIQRYIFPGGMLPTVERFDSDAADAGLRVCARSFHGQDYALTLATWRTRFDARLDEIRALGYDEAFIRMWRYYLFYCEAGFRDGRIDVMQVGLQLTDQTPRKT